jgi:hypothetical protein
MRVRPAASLIVLALLASPAYASESGDAALSLGQSIDLIAQRVASRAHELKLRDDTTQADVDRFASGSAEAVGCSRAATLEFEQISGEVVAHTLSDADAATRVNLAHGRLGDCMKGVAM